MKRFTAILLTFLSLAFLPAASISAPYGIESPSAHQAPAASPVTGGIELSNPDCDNAVTFHIISITGTLVTTVRLQGEKRVIELHQGCYIVKCPKWSRKIIVN